MPDLSQFSSNPAFYFMIGAVILVAFLGFFAWVKTLLQVCPPNEVLIFTGRRSKMADGSSRKYRVIFGGRGWRYPIIEQSARMNLNTMEVPISIRAAYSKGGIPLNVDAIANVKISSDPVIVGNAIERFLGRDPNEIRRVAKETLEGHLRGVLARLTPEQVNEDRLRFAAELTSEGEEDLQKLGIHLDTLKIQHVADDVQYLDSIGRGAIANVVREAEIAESDSKRQAEEVEAQELARASVAQANAEANIAKMRNDLRKIQADLEAQVRSEEERTSAAAKEARATAEQELQEIRSRLEGIRLQVEQVLPAEADQAAQAFRAKGEAAIFRERGRAVSQSMEMMSQAWKDAGPSAVSIMVMEDLEKILATAAKGVTKVKVNKLSIIDGGDGETMAGYVSAYPQMLATVFDAVHQVTGINVPAAISANVQEEKKS